MHFQCMVDDPISHLFLFVFLQSIDYFGHHEIVQIVSLTFDTFDIFAGIAISLDKNLNG